VEESGEVEGATVLESFKSGYIESDMSWVATRERETTESKGFYTKVAGSGRRLGEVVEVKERTTYPQGGLMTILGELGLTDCLVGNIARGCNWKFDEGAGVSL
jgi:hypothetical protein